MRTTLHISFTGHAHHGSGYGIAGLVDRAIVRDSSGVPYIPASSLKGRLRHALLRIEDGERLEGEPEAPCGGSEPSLGCKKKPCRLCRLFGSAWLRGEWEFSDGYPADRLREVSAKLAGANSRALHADSAVRMQTSMDRALGKVKDELLFSTETLDGGWQFESTVFGVAAADLQVLRHCALIVTHLGAGRARGIGRCDIRVVTTTQETGREATA